LRPNIIRKTVVTNSIQNRSGFIWIDNSQDRRISNIACVSDILNTTTMNVQKQAASTFTSSAWTAGPSCHGGWDQVNAYGVGMKWQSTDYYATDPPQTANAQTIARTTFSCPAPKNADGADTGEALSTSDRISIGVGLGVGVPSLLLTIWFGWYTRKSYLIKKKKEKEASKGVAACGSEREGLASRTADIAH
jgi:hypothetical protein